MNLDRERELEKHRSCKVFMSNSYSLCPWPGHFPATIPLAAAALQMARIPAVYITDYDQDPLQVEPYWEPYYALTV